MPRTIALHFHPDWPFRGGSVIEAMAQTGRYLPQFTTGTSNGGLTAHPGGARWEWESRLFAARYDAAPADQRPVYGALDTGDEYGPAPRFGSALLRLRSEALGRATFCYPDSAREPDGVVDLSGTADLLTRLTRDDPDPLDRYIEAHVHGGIRLEEDVAEVVLDLSHRGTPIHDAAERFGCPVTFHGGYLLSSTDVDEQYRGSAAARLARALGPVLTPAVIGDAAREGRHDPQLLKYVWHLVARFGRRTEVGHPAHSPAAPC